MTEAPSRNNEAPEVKVWGWSQVTGSVPLARHILSKWLARNDAKHYEESAVLCFSELLTNAIRIPSPDGLTNTTWTLYPKKLRVEVRDYSAEAPYLVKPDPDSESGRGLVLVHLLADDWGYETTTFLDGKGGLVPGKRVWFELHK
ncbi:ATP-binding protein [Streptomyces sp. NPDC048362]|uniref:ATP-binding protein n=1 Tax=Streptomyces sp. NPDC048362 TaxID=3365539 RepID=UPI0037190F21